jgi:hypothetical protein
LFLLLFLLCKKWVYENSTVNIFTDSIIRNCTFIK